MSPVFNLSRTIFPPILYHVFTNYHRCFSVDVVWSEPGTGVRSIILGIDNSLNHVNVPITIFLGHIDIQMVFDSASKPFQHGTFDIVVSVSKICRTSILEKFTSDLTCQLPAFVILYPQGNAGFLQNSC